VLHSHSNSGRDRSKVIDGLAEDSTANGTCTPNGLAYFYCNRREENRREPESILNALIQQLAQTAGGILKPVADFYMSRKQKGQSISRPSLQESLTLLIELVDMFPQTTILLDALDEVNNEIRLELLKSLKQVIDKSKSIVKIFGTLRNDPDILSQFNMFPWIVMDPNDNTCDINRFIKTKLEVAIADGRLLSGHVSEKLLLDIYNVLSSRSRRM